MTKFDGHSSSSISNFYPTPIRKETVYARLSVADAPFLPLLQSDLGQRNLIPVGLGASVIRGRVHMADYPDYAAFRPLDLEPSPYRLATIAKKARPRGA
jgi:hypothetical protein